ncbi:uncharacterized protein LOC119102050, partial [Pollicipes pollicipes]|uniref:uncharacterized protein LOC119102050 n=1 Tax=Pollicipes pollicipes TaxID=41117 RepID=UPI0018849B7D
MPFRRLKLDTLWPAFGISQVSVLLTPVPFQARHGATLAAACHSQPAKMKSNGVVMVLPAEVVFRAAPETAVSPIPGLPSAVSGEQASGKPFPMVMLVHLILLTRLLMVKLMLFGQLLATAAADNDGSEANIFKRPRDNTGSGEDAGDAGGAAH